jgi:hypothetical protein
MQFCKRLLAAVMVCGFAGVASAAVKPDFGPNVVVVDPSMPVAEVQAKIDKTYAALQHSEFSTQRAAFLFLPGEYHLDVPLGFYTQVLGLGATPDTVKIMGNVRSDAASRNNNATTTFWRAIEGISVSPTVNGTMRWAVSQAAPFRRMHVRGDIILHQNGWASGGWMSDSLIDGNVASGPQQQWISRNSEWKSWTGSNWNMVFVGIPNPPAGEWPKPPYTKVAETPVVREKPFLIVDAKGNYGVRVPAIARNSSGITWHGGMTPGKTIPISKFYIAKPSDTADAINAELAKGKNLLLTPGIYELTAPIHVTRANTVVLGLGFATLRPTNGTAALTTADVDGIVIAGLLFDAGEKKSPVLLLVGPAGSKASHAKNPISLHDVFFRIGGAGIGQTVENLTINSNDTIVDHTWIWRADHGRGVGWEKNLSANGLVVNGNNVTVYGLFVEHHQEYQVLWNGNGGRTYFYQSEIPYDPQTQAGYSSAPGVDGWASYKVADKVTSHEAWGLGIYSVFRNPDIWLSHAIEVPKTPKVVFHDMITVCLEKNGGMRNVINDVGGPTKAGPNRIEPKVSRYPAQ